MFVKATDSAGNSSQSDARLINYDNKPVELTIDSPKDGNQYFGSNSQTIDIVGTVSKPDSNVTVNGSFVFVGKDGSFDQRFQLSNGDNNLKVIAVDTAGNTVEKDLKVVFIP